MKKLIISEVISVILTVGVSLLIFTIFNGWEKVGQERYEVILYATFIAVIPVLITTIVFAIPALVAACVTIGVGMVITAIANFKSTSTSFVAVIINALAVVVFIVFVFADAVKKYPENISKKIAWLSFGIEVVAIVSPIVLIAFC